MDSFNFLLFYYLFNKNIENNNNIVDYLLDIINQKRKECNNDWKLLLSNFFKVIFHKRQFKNDDENYNSKNIFYNTILKLYEYYPKYIENMILNDTISNFGYYKDYIKIWELLYNDIKENYDLTNTEDIDIIYKKYNNLIVNISYILIKKKNEELKSVDEYIKQFELYDTIFKDGI
jgi:hypothetical protein